MRYGLEEGADRVHLESSWLRDGEVRLAEAGWTGGYGRVVLNVRTLGLKGLAEVKRSQPCALSIRG